MRFSQLVVEQHRIKEIDINPLLASAEISSRSMRELSCTIRPCRTRSCPASAIRPYPVEYLRKVRSTIRLSRFVRSGRRTNR